MGAVTTIARLVPSTTFASTPAHATSLRASSASQGRPARAHSTPAGLGHVLGTPAVHAPPSLDPLAWAVQREADTNPVGVDGKEVPALGSPSGQASGTENVEDPDASLAAIEEGAPFGADASGPLLEEELGAVQAEADGASARPARVSAISVLARLGSGQALEGQLRARMEAALGQDFSRVRVHADARGGELSRALAAHAFTVGEHVAFAPGRYRPASTDGQRLVAHELAHVIQQRQGLGAAILGDGIGRADDAYERAAETTAERLTAEAPESPGLGTALGNGAKSAAVALQLYSGSAASSYATKWAKSTNPAYGTLGRDDCTNFVSQAMEAGGWKYVWGSDICDERKSNSVWWFKRNQCRRWIRSNIHASHTWGGAENFYQFLDTSGRGTKLKAISDLEVGDVLQRDHNDNTIHHTMVVTKKGPEMVDGKSIIQLKLSYHSTNTLNRPFWGKGNILDEHAVDGYRYFPWSIK
jgi:hypothetical protein